MGRLWTDTESKWNFNVDPGVTLNSILDGEVKLQFDVAPRKRSAFLIMDGFQTISLPPKGLLPKLAKVKELKEMYIVTDIRICSAYVLGLTSKGSVSVHTNVSASVPVVAAPGVSASAGVGGGWSSNASVTFHEEGSRLQDPKHYTTLLTLKVMTSAWKAWLFGERGMRTSKPPEGPEFGDVVMPWARLDVDGNEMGPPVYDNPDSPIDSDDDY